MSKPPKNYRWWQDHGDGWRDEVAARKAYMPIYHLQEIFLEEYFARVAPGKVLEFGCGFGRHLEYLRRIPKLDVYGFDQSESMVEGMRWARKPWREKHVAIGHPLHKLPYADGEFDAVFTVSVLIHIRPQDVQKILRELWRVSGGHVVHIENNDTDETYVTSEEHDGCWAHDLKAAYAEAIPGANLEIASSLFEIEDVYRATDAEVDAPVFMTPARATRFLALDRKLSEELARREKASADSEHRAGKLEGRVADLQARANDLVARAKGAEEDREVQRERARVAEAANASVLDRAKEAEELNASLLDRAREAESRVEPLLGRATVAEGRVEELVDELRSVRDMVEETVARARRAEEEGVALRERATGAEARASEVSERLREARDASARALEVQASLRGDLDRARAIAEERTERVTLLEARVDSVLERAREAEGQIGQLQERTRQAETRGGELLERARVAEERQAEFRERARVAEGRLGELTERLKIERNRFESLDDDFERMRTRNQDELAARREEVGGLQARVASLNERIDEGKSERAAVERELRVLREREESATARVAELLEAMEIEVARGDQLVEALTRTQSAQERVIEQERDAQSRLIALRRRAEGAEAAVVDLRERAVDAEDRVDENRMRAERGEAKADRERQRARAAEARVDEIEAEIRALRRDCGLERQRADEALGRIDEALRIQTQAEQDLEALRAGLATLFDRA
ncbi:MAG: methyltransferase domain-containing protein [Myxococcota bacterium]